MNNISYSAIAAYKRCPKRHRFDMEPKDKLPTMAVTENYRNVAAPSVLHKLVSLHIASGFEHGVMAADAVRAYTAYEKDHPVVYEKMSAATLKKMGVTNDRELQLRKLELAIAAMEEIATDLRWHRHRVAHDKWFTAPLQGTPYTLKGQTDVWDLDVDEIFDIKVTQDRKWGDPLQLDFYAMLISLTRGYMPKNGRFIFPLVSPRYRYVERRFSTENVDSALKEATDYVANIEAQRFPAKPIDSHYCYTCPYRRFCPLWGGKVELSPIEFKTHKVSISGRMG